MSIHKYTLKLLDYLCIWSIIFHLLQFNVPVFDSCRQFLFILQKTSKVVFKSSPITEVFGKTLNLTLLLVISVKIVEAEKFSMRRINVADEASSYFNKIVCNSKNKSELSIHIILGQGEIDLRLNSFGWISSYIYQMHAGLNCLSCSMFIPK